MEFLVVTGMSGAGKSNAANALEDIGFYCVDNIPPKLIPAFIDLAVKGDLELSRVAIVTDTRGGNDVDKIEEIYNEFNKRNINYKILFLNASDTELRRRYSETRRRHPLSDDNDFSVVEAIVKERELLSNIRAKADYVIDTTSLTAGQLKKQLTTLFLGSGATAMTISCMSFGYKYGPVPDANLVFDVRCLPNPFYVDDLRHLTGLDEKVSSYVMGFESSKKFADKILNLIEYAVPIYCDEGKSQLVIALGCTGGKHRSVTFAELIFKRLKKLGYRVTVNHRDIEKR